MNGVLMTLDMGTSGLKAALFDETGERLACALAPCPCRYPAPGLAQQDPEDYVKAAVKAGRALILSWGGDTGRIAAIGLSGTMNGLIPVDESGRALYDNIIHSDTRGEEEMPRLICACGAQAYRRLTGHRPDCRYTLPKLMWLKAHEPAIYRRAASILQTKDYLYQRLTGKKGVTDPSDASLSGCFELAKGAFSRDLLRALDLDPGKLPDILPSCDVSGKLTKEMAEAMGLPPGLPVAVGGGDGACATRGSGIAGAGEVYDYIGSSAWVAGLSEKPVEDDRLFHIADLDGKHLDVIGTLQTAASAFDWARTLLCPEMKDDFSAIDGMIAQVPAGSDGVFFLPYLMGDRTPHWDARIRGGWLGASLNHDRRHLLRAVLESAAFAQKNALDVLEEAGITADSVTLIGGGAKSALWRNIYAHVFARGVRVHAAPGEATSLGAAMAAGVGAGLFDWAGASKMAKRSDPIPLDAETEKRYAAAYGRFNRLYPAAAPLYATEGE